MNQPDQNIDELLNSFIDGELSDNQRMEVQRLITQDTDSAKRLRQLQKVKMLISSLPPVMAPASIVEAVSKHRTPNAEHRTPKLVFRKVLAAAAMIALLTIFAGVIYTILAPESTPIQPRQTVAVVESLPPRVSQAGFSGRLELKTVALSAVDAFINRAIKDNNLSDYVNVTRQANRNFYSFTCSREDLNLLLSDLQSIWQRFSLATLSVDTEQFNSPVIVSTITADQTTKIISQTNPEKAVETARDFAVLNNMAELMPGKQILTAINGGSVNLIPQGGIPKPVLTGEQKTVKKTNARPEDRQEVSLTIVVVGSN